MEYIFGLTEGRYAIIYDEGNQILLLFLYRGKIIHQAILEREYHSELHAFLYENKIYLAYVTVSNAIAWMEVGGNGRRILYATDNPMCYVENLCMLVMDGKLVLFFESEIEDKGLCRMLYNLPLGNRKSFVLGEWKQNVTCSLLSLGGHIICSVTKGEDEKLYQIKENDAKRYTLEEIVLNGAHDVKQEQIEADFVKQYNELVEFTKQLQEEGKKWRDMYYAGTQNKHIK